jgi:signal transduction histidine kinase
LLHAISRLLHEDGERNYQISVADETDFDQRVADEIYAKAAQDISRKLVHDIKRLIGFIDFNASVEVTKYDTSETKSSIERLSLLVQAIEKLSIATSAPAITQFDFAALISRIVYGESRGYSIDISLSGPKPFLVKCDVQLLSLVLTGAVRNAVESMSDLKESHRRLIVNWNKDNQRYWVAVFDTGIGLAKESKELFEMSKTTKQKHFGLGLFLAKTAITSIRGEISLHNRGDGDGAVLKFSWPLDLGVPS